MLLSPHLRLWAHEEQVEAPDVSRNACVLCVVAKHSSATALGELCVLIVEVLCNRQYW